MNTTYMKLHMCTFMKQLHMYLGQIFWPNLLAKSFGTPVLGRVPYNPIVLQYNLSIWVFLLVHEDGTGAQCTYICKRFLNE
jgi:hypothetical protein